MLQGIIEFAARNQVVVHDAVHARRRDGAGDPRRRARGAERRGAGRHGPDPGRPARRAGHLRRLHLERRHAVGRAGVRDARSTCGRRWSAASWPGATACPYRSSNVSAANALDAQAAYESVFSLWGAVMGGVNLLMHGAGWMEGGLHASFEKMILDAELLGMVEAFLDPIVVDEDTLASRRDAGGRPGRPLLRRGPHPVALSDRVPQADALRLAELRDVGGGRLARAARPRPTGSGRSCSPPTSRRRWTRPSARSSTPSSPAARPRAASPPTTERRTA